jgi:orotidine-5'-phosphate decarboxylase
LEHFADRLVQAVRAKGNALSIGLDPRWDSLPDELKKRYGNQTLAAVARAYEDFCARIIDVAAPLVPVVKPQCAFFEACGPAGMRALKRTLRRARRHGLITILDGKRNDIADTAVAYAEAFLAGSRFGDKTLPVWDADALTVNGYLGRDSVEPFLKEAARSGRGVFVVTRTSNPGARQFQDLVSDGRPLYQHVAQAVASWSKESLGASGFGLAGAVVGATYPAELAELRRLCPSVWFLVPGFGAQGAGAGEVAGAFREDGLGAIINSSRGIIFSYPPAERDWENAIREATLKTIEALAKATPMGRLRPR